MFKWLPAPIVALKCVKDSVNYSCSCRVGGGEGEGGYALSLSNIFYSDNIRLRRSLSKKFDRD